MLRQRFVVSERLACTVADQSRSVQSHIPTQKADEDELTEATGRLASEYGRYGYRRITALLTGQANDGLVQLILISLLCRDIALNGSRLPRYLAGESL